MGVHKASLMVGDRPMIAHVIDRMREALPHVVVVSREGNGLDVQGVHVIYDEVQDKTGALVGIYSALRAVRTPYVFVVACDMPHIQPELVRWMVEAFKGEDAFVPKVGSNIEPLFAIYARSCLPQIEKRLASGDLRVRGFFEDVKTVYVEEGLLRAVDPNLASFVNINTREDLENLRRSVTGASKEVPRLNVVEAEAGSYRSVRITRIRDAGGQSEEACVSDDVVVTEAEVFVTLNGEPAGSLQCSPHSLDALVVGWMLTGNLIRRGQRVTVCGPWPLPDTTGSGQTLRVAVDVADNGSLGKACDELKVSPRQVCDAVDDLLRISPLFGLTGAAHAAALCSACGIVYWSEDIGRHNAVDRVVGQCFLEGDSFEDKYLATTGSINSEMVKKAAACGVRLIASKAPPTDLGVGLADRLGISVVGFVRNNRLNVYTHPDIWRRDM